MDFGTLQQKFPGDPVRGPHFTLKENETEFDQIGEEAELDQETREEANETSDI